MPRKLLALGVCAAALIFPSAAQAKDCTKYEPFVHHGTHWVVYTFSQPGRASVTCSKARRMTHRTMHGRRTPGWRCSKRLQRCVRGGTYIDEYGYSQWRYVVGWHHAD